MPWSRGPYSVTHDSPAVQGHRCEFHAKCRLATLLGGSGVLPPHPVSKELEICQGRQSTLPCQQARGGRAETPSHNYPSSDRWCLPFAMRLIRGLNPDPGNHWWWGEGSGVAVNVVTYPAAAQDS